MSSSLLTIVGYEPSHLENLKAKKCHEGEMPKTVCNQAVTIMNGDIPLAIVGAFTFVPGVHHVWALVSDDVKDHPIGFYRACVALRNYYEKKSSPRRLQIDIRDGHPDLQKWANAIGFSREGLMRGYGPDRSDYWLYGRVC